MLSPKGRTVERTGQPVKGAWHGYFLSEALATVRKVRGPVPGKYRECLCQNKRIMIWKEA